jgi:coat protein
MRETKKLPSISNVGADLTAVLECPLGKTYDRIMLAYSGTAVTRAMLKNIQVMISGRPVQIFKDADRLQEINDFYGRDDNAGYITLYFARPEMHNIIQQRTTGIGTADISSLSVKIDIDSSAPGDLAITATAILSEPNFLGLITKVRSFPTSSDVTGEIEISDIPRRARIQAIHFFKADISNVVVEVDSMKVFESSKALAEVIQKEHGRVPVTAKATHVDFQLEGDNAQALVMQNVQDFRLKPTFDTTGALDVVVEYFDGLPGL